MNWYKVVGVARYSPTNNPHPSYPCSVVLELECGHFLHRKAAQPIPKKARCKECEYKANIEEER